MPKICILKVERTYPVETHNYDIVSIPDVLKDQSEWLDVTTEDYVKIKKSIEFLKQHNDGYPYGCQYIMLEKAEPTDVFAEVLETEQRIKKAKIKLEQEAKARKLRQQKQKATQLQKQRDKELKLLEQLKAKHESQCTNKSKN